MKKILFLIVAICSTTIYSQTFLGNLGSNNLKWNTDLKDFNSPPRVGVDPMSIKLWDNYHNVNAPSDFGSLLEISGKESHMISQLYFDNNWNGSRIFYRSAFYDQNNWESWRYLLDSRNDVESFGNLKIAGNGNSYVLGNVGIGTTNPEQKFVVSNNGAEGLEFYLNQPPNVVGLQSYNRNLHAYSKMQLDASEFSFMIGNVGIGTTNPTSKLTVAGNIHAQEVKVTINAGLVPDYVFANDYKLKPLKEVEDYIKQNSHLPEIPSATEIEKNGLMLAEMNLRLLKKIEELTLYTIELNKKNLDLEKRLDKLESK